MKNKYFYILSLCLILGFSRSTNAFQNEVIKSLNTSITFTSDLFANTSGGNDTGMRYMDNLDVQIISKWNDISFFAYGLANHGGSISELTGEIQSVSNIEAEHSWRLYEVWANVPITTLNGSLLVGLYDLNSEFDVINTGRLFLNSSHGIGPDFSSSGVTGPSIFPYTSLAVRFKVNFMRGFTFKGAILDAVPSDPRNTRGTKIHIRENEGSLITSEISWNKNLGINRSVERGVHEGAPIRVVIGIWKYSKKRVGWDDQLKQDAGIYFIAEGKIFSEMNDINQGLSVFGRFGAVNAEINQFKNYYGAGLTYTGLFPHRDKDLFGIAASLPVNGDQYLENSGFNFSYELIAEFTYLLNVTDKLSLQFDAQYIANPNQQVNLKDAVLVGLRSTISF